MNEENKNVEEKGNMTVNYTENSGVSSLPVLAIMTFIMAIGNFAGWWTIGWVWVFCPLWAPFALLGGVLSIVLALVVIIVLFAGVALLFEIIKEKF
jgi:hypothetical protein